MSSKTIDSDQSIAIGVSACLIGAKVRFDGGHKRNHYISELLSEQFKLISFCPEVAIGMSTPREPIRLVNNDGEIRVTGTRDNSLDVTEELTEYGNHIGSSLSHLCGFVFKKDSPSCGMARVKVYGKDGIPQKNGVGLFAHEVMRLNPLLPVEEEGRLNDPKLRENFINRVYVFARWKKLLANGLTKKGLLDFHTRHKYLLLSHHQTMYRQLGRRLAKLNIVDINKLGDSYIATIMEVLKQPSSRRKHVNVLQHLMGFLRDRVSSDDRAEISDMIRAYGRGEYPLVVPITLLNHHFRKCRHPFTDQQVYLNPHPRELMLRNSI